jgi:hypothetical protein
LSSGSPSCRHTPAIEVVRARLRISASNMWVRRERGRAQGTCSTRMPHRRHRTRRKGAITRVRIPQPSRWRQRAGRVLGVQGPALRLATAGADGGDPVGDQVHVPGPIGTVVLVEGDAPAVGRAELQCQDGRGGRSSGLCCLHKPEGPRVDARPSSSRSPVERDDEAPLVVAYQPTSRRRGGRHPKGRSAAEEARSALAAPTAAATPPTSRSPEREMNQFPYNIPLCVRQVSWVFCAHVSFAVALATTQLLSGFSSGHPLNSPG